MIDFKGIRTKFKLIAMQQVGSYLSQVGVNGDIPAVIDARPTLVDSKALPKPPYPYITVDIYGPINDTNFYDRDRYFDEDTGQMVHATKKTVMVRYTCYGGVSSSENADLAQYITNELCNKFRLGSVIDDLEDSIGVAPQMVTDIDNLPTLLSTYYLETASFNVLCDVVDTVSDPNTFVIEEVDLTGEVVLQDNSTISANVNIET